MVCIPCRKPSVQDTRYNNHTFCFFCGSCRCTEYILSDGRVCVRQCARSTDANCWNSSWEQTSPAYPGRPFTSTRMEIRLAGEGKIGSEEGGKTLEPWAHAPFRPAGTKSWTSSTSARTSTPTSTWEAGIRVAYKWMTRKSGVTAATSSNLSALSPAKRDRSKYGPL